MTAQQDIRPIRAGSLEAPGTFQRGIELACEDGRRGESSQAIAPNTASSFLWSVRAWLPSESTTCRCGLHPRGAIRYGNKRTMEVKPASRLLWPCNDRHAPSASTSMERPTATHVTSRQRSRLNPPARETAS